MTSRSCLVGLVLGQTWMSTGAPPSMNDATRRSACWSNVSSSPQNLQWIELRVSHPLSAPL